MKTWQLFLLTGAFLAEGGNVVAQSPASWEDFVEQTMDEEENDRDETEEVRYEELSELHGLRLNLNQATVPDLLQLPFLTEEQARDIVYYRDTQGPLLSTGELMFIESLGKQEREYLQLFCYAGEEENAGQNTRLTLKQLLRHMRSEAFVRGDIPFYYKAGYQNYPDEVLSQYPNRQYRGDPTHVRFRYSLNSMNHLQAGIQAEKDAGERGVDYLSGYVLLKDLPTGRRSCIREAVVGSYRAHFGLGLAMNTSVSFGKTMMLSSLGRMDKGLSRHSSALETGYLTGAGIRYQTGRLTVAAIGAYNKTDGTFRNDSIGISALKTDGLHRTPLEWSKRHNISVVNFGGNIHWETGNWQVSATAVATHYSTPIAPKWNTLSTLYRKYNARGQDFQVYSLASSYRGARLQWSGEVAMSHAKGLPGGEGRQQGVATLQTLQWHINGKNLLTAAARYYGAKFVSINGNAFGENARPQNEQGLYVGWKTTVLPRWRVETYVDIMRFPWLKYGVSDPSIGVEYMVQGTYTAGRHSTWLVRYRIKAKEKDYNSGEDSRFLQYDKRHSLKVQHSLTIGRQWTFRTMLNGCLVDFGPSRTEKGLTIGEHVRWTGIGNRLRIDLGITYFHTDTYNARVYAYEPSLLYSFGMTSYYYKGIRGLLMVNYAPLKGLTLTAKLGMTKYFDRETIGTGTEEIFANHREDLQVMARWRF